VRDWLSADEVDLVMANIHPSSRRWCSASCGFAPGEEPIAWGCACCGCIYGALSWEEFSAWQERENNRDETTYIPEEPRQYRQLSLQERLAVYKANKLAMPTLFEIGSTTANQNHSS
jgi:hypothetical protein